MEKPIPAEIIARLGEISDSALAEEAGVNTETIRRLRKERGIRASRTTIRWTPEMDKHLGTDTDEAVSKKLGLSRIAVLLRRQRIGRAPSRPLRLGYLNGETTAGVVTLTAHISEEVRAKADELRAPLLQKYRAAGLPMREVSLWQVIEHAVAKLYEEMMPR